MPKLKIKPTRANAGAEGAVVVAAGERVAYRAFGAEPVPSRALRC